MLLNQMKYYPNDEELRKHIAFYWVVNDEKFCQNSPVLRAYPGVKPELIIVLGGSLSYHYKGKKYQVNESEVFSFITDFIVLDTSKLKSFVMVQFKPKALASLLPFVTYNATQIMSHSICSGKEIFGEKFSSFVMLLKQCNPTQISAELDTWFLSLMKYTPNSFVDDFVDGNYLNYSPKAMLDKTKLSYSTLERYFKKEIGLTPKKFQSLKIYKMAVEEIYNTQSSDWMHYVNKYNYFDQSHFIKEIKRYTQFTPSQLLQINGLPSFR